jgi:hypothetical protein
MPGRPSNTKISSEGRHRECPDLVCCILLFCGCHLVKAAEYDACAEEEKHSYHEHRNRTPHKHHLLTEPWPKAARPLSYSARPIQKVDGLDRKVTMATMQEFPEILGGSAR